MTPVLTVLHVLNSHNGGSVISTLELIKALNRKGIKSSIIADAAANEHQRAYISQHVEGRALFIPVYWMNKRIRASWWKRPIIELIALWKTWGGYRYQTAIDTFIQQHGVNLIHSNAIVMPEGAIAARRNNLPHVWHVRELVGPNKHFRFYNYKQWSSWVSKHSNVLVANSTVTANCLKEFFDESKIRIVPNAITTNEFTVKIHQPSSLVIVGMVGSMVSRWKNHRFFIETASRLKNENIEFRIYGAIPAADDVYFTGLKNLVNRLEVQNSVRFMEAQAPPVIMNEIDILFHPTNLESFGRIFIEAMAGGIPVVAINQGGALEMVKNNVNGYLIPLNDIDAAIRAIQRLVDDHELRNQLGVRGRELSEKEYSMDTLCKNIAKLYKDVLADSQSIRHNQEQ